MANITPFGRFRHRFAGFFQNLLTVAAGSAEQTVHDDTVVFFYPFLKFFPVKLTALRLP